MIERLAQFAMVALAAIAGWLSVGSRGATTRGALTDHGGVAPALAASPSGQAALPRNRLRRPEGTAAVMFTPVVVDFSQLPAEQRPEDLVRDPAWAPLLEAGLERRVTGAIADLFPTARVAVACKSWTCQVDVTGSREQAATIHEFIQRTLPLGPRVGNDLSVLESGEVELEFSVDLGDVPTLDEWQRWIAAIDQRHRLDAEAVIAAQREGRPWPGAH